MPTLKIAKDLFDLLYPVGTYYETSNANWTPSNAGWYGTWVEDTAGKTTVAKDDETFKTLGGSVGSETYTTNNHTLTADESGLPKHNHSGKYNIFVNALGEISGCGLGGAFTPNGFGRTSAILNDAGPSNAKKGHNHGDVSTIQPSIVVRRWHRTA